MVLREKRNEGVKKELMEEIKEKSLSKPKIYKIKRDWVGGYLWVGGKLTDDHNLIKGKPLKLRNETLRGDRKKSGEQYEKNRPGRRRPGRIGGQRLI